MTRDPFEVGQEELQAEEWRPIPGYPGYEVSSLGRVRTWRLRGMHGGRMASRPTILRQRVGRASYPRLRLGYVHSLVLIAFAGPRPDGHVACHCDGTRTNNRASNLRWDTPSGNEHDKILHGTSRHGLARPMQCIKRGSANAQAKLTEPVVSLMRWLHDAHGVGFVALARWFSISRTSAYNVTSRKRWQHV